MLPQCDHDRPTASSGVLLHPTSLPGGRLGEPPAFVDWLAAAGQSWWQVLPLGPPGRARLAVHGRLGLRRWRGCSPETGRAGLRRTRSTRFVPASGVDRRLGRLRRAGARRRPGAFEREWDGAARLRAERGVRLIGDVPIYVAPGGADHRRIPSSSATALVAGAPPDSSTAKGQLWGNPLYDWPAPRAPGYRWWVERFRRTFELVDVGADRPLPRVRRLLGRARRRGRRPRRGQGGAPGRVSSTRRDELASCR